MTRAAVFLNRFFYKVWFFGACYYWGTWVFLVVSFDITLLFLSLNRMFFLFFWCGLDFHLVSQFESQLIKLLQRKTLWPSLTDLKKNERFSSLNKLWCSNGEKVKTKIWYQMLIRVKLSLWEDKKADFVNICDSPDWKHQKTVFVK